MKVNMNDGTLEFSPVGWLFLESDVPSNISTLGMSLEGAPGPTEYIAMLKASSFKTKPIEIDPPVEVVLLPLLMILDPALGGGVGTVVVVLEIV
jgi:hypothetical protein